MLNADLPHVHAVRFNMHKHGDAMMKENVGAKELGNAISNEVRGFPTVMFYSSKSDRTVYEGPRDAETILTTAKAYFDA
jgi:hypothetical protein